MSTSSTNPPDSTSSSLSAKASAYRSLPLTANCNAIRAFDVYPLSEDEDEEDIIRGSLRVIDLDKNPDFTALSYVWGCQSLVPKTVTYGSLKIPVSDSCHSALVHLRRKLGGFTIWIDALCINQDDDKEKAQQIPLMGRIYQDARSVYVWLGEGSLATDRAMKYLENVGLPQYFFVDGDPTKEELASPRPWAAAWTWFIWSFVPKHQQILSMQSAGSPNRLLSSSKIIPASYHDLTDLLTKQWITRLWTFQEIVLASHPVLVCGDCHLPWSRFELSMAFLDHMKYKPNLLIELPIVETLTTWNGLIQTRQSLLSSRGTSDASRERLQRYHLFLDNTLRKYAINRKLWPSALFIFWMAVLVITFWRIVANKHSLSGGGTIGIVFLLLVLALVAVAAPIYCMITSPKMLLPHSWTELFRSQPRNALQKESVDNIIDALCTRKATEPKDMAFGFQSVLQQLSSLDVPTIDYSFSKGDIYKRFAVQLLRCTNSLQLLITAALTKVDDQPSWIPDWSTKPFSFLLNPKDDGQIGSPSRVIATPHSHPYLDTRNANEGLISVWGIQIGTVTFCSGPKRTSETYLESEHKKHLSNLMLIRSLIVTQIGLECEGDSFVHALLHHFALVHELPKGISAEFLHEYFRFMIWDIEKSTEEVLALLTSQNLWHRIRNYRSYSRTQQILRPSLLRKLLNFHIFFCNFLASTDIKFLLVRDLQLQDESYVIRRWPTTKYRKRQRDRKPGVDTLGGDFGMSWGVCSDQVKAGDKIVLVSGVTVPLVMRAKESTHELVSSTVMCQEVMRGGAWLSRDQVVPRENLQEFVLS